MKPAMKSAVRTGVVIALITPAAAQADVIIGPRVAYSFDKSELRMSNLTRFDNAPLQRDPADKGSPIDRFQSLDEVFRKTAIADIKRTDNRQSLSRQGGLLSNMFEAGMRALAIS